MFLLLTLSMYLFAEFLQWKEKQSAIMILEMFLSN